MALEELRNKIDNINSQIIQLLAERAEVSKKIADEKKKIGKDIYDPDREEEYGLGVVKKIAPLTPNAVYHIYGVEDNSSFFKAG
ncbi:MAG: chorismate mutase, partial [Nanoarchaeota archaeon]|nr:chorismate mutase [Nanoarchaeota archaeon]